MSSSDHTTTRKGTIAVLGAGGYMAGPICQHLKQKGGYYVIGFVRPSTDTSALTLGDVVDVICKGDLSDPTFLQTSIENHSSSDNIIAIINFINQLMPPCDTILKQLENDLPPIRAGLQAASNMNCTFIHTSGNFSIPTAGNIGGTFTTQLPAKPCSDQTDVNEIEHWETFQHEGGMEAVATLAEAKHRQDWFIEDFVVSSKQKKWNKAIVMIPAGIYGPGLGSKITFWDYAAGQFLQEKFVDFAHAFLHIEDAAEAYLALITQLVENPNKIWNHVNAGDFPYQNLKSKRLALYGESMTVREFVSKYAAACGVPMLSDDVGPKASDEERHRIYEDSATKQLLHLAYKHTLKSSNDGDVSQSLLDSVENLRQRNLLQVK